MIEFTLLAHLYTSPQFCQEYGWELYNAADRQEITLEQADTLFERCDATYNQGN